MPQLWSHTHYSYEETKEGKLYLQFVEQDQVLVEIFGSCWSEWNLVELVGALGWISGNWVILLPPPPSMLAILKCYIQAMKIQPVGDCCYGDSEMINSNNAQENKSLFLIGFSLSFSGFCLLVTLLLCYWVLQPSCTMCHDYILCNISAKYLSHSRHTAMIGREYKSSSCW
jgi:hypothetical protein